MLVLSSSLESGIDAETGHDFGWKWCRSVNADAMLKGDINLLQQLRSSWESWQTQKRSRSRLGCVVEDLLRLLLLRPEVDCCERSQGDESGLADVCDSRHCDLFGGDDFFGGESTGDS